MVSEIIQEAVLTINKEGCEAADYTSIGYDGEAPKIRCVSFIADRPFICFISDSVNTPLFVEDLNDPKEKNTKNTKDDKYEFKKNDRIYYVSGNDNVMCRCRNTGYSLC